MESFILSKGLLVHNKEGNRTLSTRSTVPPTLIGVPILHWKVREDESSSDHQLITFSIAIGNPSAARYQGELEPGEEPTRFRDRSVNWDRNVSNYSFINQGNITFDYELIGNKIRERSLCVTKYYVTHALRVRRDLDSLRTRHERVARRTRVAYMRTAPAEASCRRRRAGHPPHAAGDVSARAANATTEHREHIASAKIISD
ncbi:unnamed protein product [Leptidea sinapis]|uniref:Uncharacterized protein n=1 Tax=Leptidea sinapis TaxID=189913 RepID=A0A5E4PL35_9NEOP|nr:unnamed protein product [Leptidea sinapis]